MKKPSSFSVIIVLLLTILTLQIRQQFRSGTSSVLPDEITVQTIEGFVRDETEQPIASVIITAPEFRASDTTGANGTFKITFQAQKYQSVRLYLNKSGYMPWNEYTVAGNKDVRFTLQQQK